MSYFLFDNIEFLVKQKKTVAIKNKAKDPTSVFVVVFDGKKYIVKKYVSNSWFKFFINLFRKSKARLCWENSLLLKSLGINVAEPVFYKENKPFGLKFRSYFVCEYVDGVTLCDYFAKDKSPKSKWMEVSRRVAELLNSLYENNIIHHDFCGKNIMLKDGELFLLDLEHLVQYKKKNKKFLSLHQKDIDLFLNYYNLHKEAKTLCEETIKKRR